MGRRESPGYAEWGDPGPYDAAPYYDAEAPPYPGLDAFASGPPRRRKRSNLPCLIALLLLVLAGTAAGVLFGVVKIQDQKPDAASPSSRCVDRAELRLTTAARRRDQHPATSVRRDHRAAATDRGSPAT